MNLPSIVYLLCIFFLGGVFGSRVLELSDRFLELVGGEEDTPWLVMFYAPWCAYCHRVAPVWAHVAQALHSSPVRVARLDCTRFPTTASHFKVRAYPTIIFVKGSVRHEYSGEQSKEELTRYAQRMSAPPVTTLSKEDQLHYLKETHDVFFTYVGAQDGPLWEMYSHLAIRLQPLASFYSTSHDVASTLLDLELDHIPTVFVYKDSQPYFFRENVSALQDRAGLNASLGAWLEAERVGTFPRVSQANLKHLMALNKFLVLAVLEEDKRGEVPQHHRDFRDMLEMIIREKKEELHPHFQFGWLSSPELAHSIVLEVLPLPHLLVINSSTLQHHLPEGGAHSLTPDSVLSFLQQVYNNTSPPLGGDTWRVRAYRVYFQARTSLEHMWKGNPVLTALIFGLPLGFLSLIFYSACCTDILDADTEDTEGDGHEKKE